MRSLCRFRLTTKLTLAAVLSTALCGALTLAITVTTLNDAAKRQEQQRMESNLRVAWQMLRTRYPDVRLVDGTLRAGDAVLDGDTTLVDRLREMVGGVATIFSGTTRVATNVKLGNGERATGTSLGPGPAYDAVVVHHVRYSGVADILGEPHVTVYDPILDPEGEQIGILFVGERLSAFRDALQTTRDRILLGGAGAVILVGLSFSLLARRMFRPLHGLTSAMLRLASRDLTAEVPGLNRGDEIGGMARAVRVFKENSIQIAAQEGELRRSAEQLAAALSNISQGLCMFDGAGNLEMYNRQFCDIYRIEPGAMRPGLSLREVLILSRAGRKDHSMDLDEILRERKAFIDRHEAGTMVLKVGTTQQIEIVQRPMPNGGYVATYEDVTDQLAAEEKIAYMARHDLLTGLSNRLVLQEHIDEALTASGRGACSAILCLDLDHFKRVNDTLGHSVGDDLLRAVSDRLLACVRDGDIVARLSGDEFAIVQADISRPEDAKLLAERIIGAVQEPFAVGGHQVSIGVSIGLALVPTDGSNSTALLKNADTALYRAKLEGRGAFCFFEQEMDERLQRRRQLELDLRNGLLRDEFQLFYQPLVSLATDQVTGFEALLRWQHPARGMVSPDEFIPIAEEIGLIVPLGEWVIRKACIDAASWPDGITVAVNLSPVQFRSKNLVPEIERALAASGLPAARLEFEITETVLLQDSESTLATLHQLHALGLRISMDDFGTGYSSLSYLRSFPFDKIKIDQSFIRDLSSREESIHVVRAVQGLCVGLGMRTTAEGVETEEQLAKLRAEGCLEVQGFLFSPPRPAADIPSILERVRMRSPVPVASRIPLLAYAVLGETSSRVSDNRRHGAAT